MKLFVLSTPESGLSPQHLAQSICSHTKETLWNGLSENRTDEEKNEIMNTCFNNFEDLISESIENSTETWPMFIVIFKKTI